MFTSCFKLAGSHADAVAISVGLPSWYTGKRFLPLAPTRAMLKMSSATYQFHYEQILAKLNPQQTFDELQAMVSGEPILLCFEPPGKLCHRLYVSRWFRETIGVNVPEWTPPAPAQGSLFL